MRSIGGSHRRVVPLLRPVCEGWSKNVLKSRFISFWMVLSSATGSQRISAMRTSLGEGEACCPSLPLIDLSRLMSSVLVHTDRQNDGVVAEVNGDVVAIADSCRQQHCDPVRSGERERR